MDGFNGICWSNCLDSGIENPFVSINRRRPCHALPTSASHLQNDRLPRAVQPKHQDAGLAVVALEIAEERQEPHLPAASSESWVPVVSRMEILKKICEINSIDRSIEKVLIFARLSVSSAALVGVRGPCTPKKKTGRRGATEKCHMGRGPQRLFGFLVVVCSF